MAIRVGRSVVSRRRKELRRYGARCVALASSGSGCGGVRWGLATALGHLLQSMSRVMARLEQNAAVIREAPRCDLGLLNEADAARRASQEDSEFDSATLLLDLLRKLQLSARALGILLHSATP